MNTVPNYPVTFFDFKEWLDSKSANDVVGEALTCDQCPLARLLTDKGHQEVEVYPLRSYVDSIKYDKNPGWVYDFVKKVDTDKQVGEQITAGECLKILNNLYICTVCNKYNPEGTNCGKKDNCPW
jgi:hypothetical protein